ncbi:MAG: GDSL-type esterase/lipase family protein [Clostridiales Family XIII bacterium]|jgi:lysophospholipase L1-like esterase|nr:GDSL-type esterase/lipase family protein [Clostridiales Family XIII bacterium]
MKKGLRSFLKAFAIVAFVAAIWVGMALGYALNQSAAMGDLYKIKYGVTGYPQGNVLLVGSSSIQVWQGSARDLSPYHTDNIGISGSVVDDWFPLVDTLIKPFGPVAVVVYVGSNDLHALFRSPEDTAEDVELLIDDIHAALPDAVIYYVSVYTAAATEDLREQDERFNELAKEAMGERGYARFVDTASALTGENGDIRDDIFLSDLVHLNEAGYALWTPAIRDALSLDFES